MLIDWLRDARQRHGCVEWQARLGGMGNLRRHTHACALRVMHSLFFALSFLVTAELMGRVTKTLNGRNSFIQSCWLDPIGSR